MWEAIAIDGRTCARDTDTGALMTVSSLPDYLMRIAVQLPARATFNLYMSYEQKYAGAKGIGAHNPMIQLLVGDFSSVVKASIAPRAEKTKLIRYLLEGMAAINRKWPLCYSPYFYSDLDHYGERAKQLFDFDFPSDDELALLTRPRD